MLDSNHWGVVTLIAAVTLFSLYKWRACPYLCHTKAISLDESRQQLDRPFVAGVFAVRIEPALLQIEQSVARVVTARSRGPDAVGAAEERLRYAHLWLVSANFTILLAVVLTLLAF